MEMLVEITPEAYKDYVTYDCKKNKTSCLNMLQLLHGMMKVAMLCYKQFVKDMNESRHGCKGHGSLIINYEKGHS